MDFIEKSDIIGMSFEGKEGIFCLACIEADEELRKKSPLDSIYFDELSTEAEFKPGEKCQKCGKEFLNREG